MMLILMLIIMLKFCVKESSNLIGQILGPQGISLQPRWVGAPYQSESDQISPNSPNPHPNPHFPHQIFRFTKFLHYYYLKLEIKE